MLFIKNIFYFICFQFAIIISSDISASELINEYSVELLTKEDGFVSSEIYSIVQDKQGLLWFGTGENGVMRYDGRKVTVFEFNNNHVNGLSHNDAGNLMLDKQGRIWIGTWGGGANLYNPTTGIFKYFVHDPERLDSLASNRVQSFLNDAQDQVWLGTYADGLNRYISGDKFEHFSNNPDVKSSLSHNRIWDIEDNDDNSLWVATSFGLDLFDKKEKTFTHFFPEPENKTPTGANEIRNILKTKLGKLFVGTQLGVFEFNPQLKKFTPITTVTGVSLGQINSMIEDHNGHIWFVSSSGIYRLSNKTLGVEKLSLGHESGLRIVFEDSSGIIWVTSEIHGIYKVIPNRKFKAINDAALTAPNGITIDSNGDLIIATATSNLYRWQVSAQKLVKLTDEIFKQADGFSVNRLLAPPVVFQATDDVLWIAQDSRLAKYDLKSKQISILKYPNSGNKSNEFRELSALNEDQFGNIWIGTYKNGVYLYNQTNHSFLHLDESFGLTHPEVIDIFKDNAGNMWVGTGDNASIWDPKKQRFIPFTNENKSSFSLLGNIVQDIHQSRDGKIWIATQHGLNLFIPETQKFTHFNSKNGLPISLVRAIEDDVEGNLWLTTNKGISRLNPLTGEVVNFDGDDGLLGLNFYSNSLVRANDGTIFTSSQRGIEYFNTLNMQALNKESNIVLTGFYTMGKSIQLDKPYSYVTDISVSYLDSFLSFEFSVLDFSSPTKNQYAYKLDGFDDNWIEIGNHNVTSFTNLNGGLYKFMVKATNSNGKWGEQILTINLYVSPPPWKTWWAYSLYILAILLLTSAAIIYRTRFQQNEIAKQKQFVTALEEQVADKTASLNEQAESLLEANKKLEMLTYQDGLTGIYNRRYFDQYLQTEISRHHRERKPLSLILCDIDHFKAYNDFYGHLAGDHCLKQVAACIQKCVSRTSDANCRYGGEEFAIILPNTNEVQSSSIAERLRQAIEDEKIPHEKSETNSFLTMTLGVFTAIPERNNCMDTFILSADTALYVGKANGRNRVT